MRQQWKCDNVTCTRNPGSKRKARPGPLVWGLLIFLTWQTWVPGEPVAQGSGGDVDTCSTQLPGDANGDGQIDLADVNYILAVICQDAPPPVPPANGDANGDCIIDQADAEYVAAYLTAAGPAPVGCTCQEPALAPCPLDTCSQQMPGDLNGDGLFGIDDLVFLTDFVCARGEAPVPLANGDVNGDCRIDTADVDYLAVFLAHGGPPPVECTCVNPRFGWIRGDCNKNCRVNGADVILLINYVLKSGTPPYPVEEVGNTDCVPPVNSADIIYLVNFVFKDGPAPPRFCP